MTDDQSLIWYLCGVCSLSGIDGHKDDRDLGLGPSGHKHVCTCVHAYAYAHPVQLIAVISAIRFHSGRNMNCTHQ